jgi:hypothetical protein
MSTLGHPRLRDETAKRDSKRTFGAHPENGSIVGIRLQVSGFRWLQWYAAAQNPRRCIALT